MTKTSDSLTSKGSTELIKRPKRLPYGQWVLILLLLYVLAGVASTMVQSPNLGPATVVQYIVDPVILKGVLVTLEITILSIIIGMAGALVIALMRLSKNRILSGTAWVYIQVFRGIPPLVLLLFWGFMGAVFPKLGIGIPFTDIQFIAIDANTLLTPFVAAVIALSMLQAAYGAEVIRSGILSVPVGQLEAAASLGLTKGETMRRIVLPQAMRIIIPPLGNEITFILKATSLVSVIGGAELMTTVQRIYAQDLNVIPLLLVASIWYIFLVTVVSVVQYFVERRMAPAKTVSESKLEEQAA